MAFPNTNERIKSMLICMTSCSPQYVNHLLYRPNGNFLAFTLEFSYFRLHNFIKCRKTYVFKLLASISIAIALRLQPTIDIADKDV